MKSPKSLILVQGLKSHKEDGNMKSMQSFLMFFYILDQCYEICSEDDLGRLLGIISPELWQDGRPIDEAVLVEWQQKSKMMEVNEKNIIDVTIIFLVSYERRYGFDFSCTKHLLSRLNKSKIIAKAKNKTQIMYQKYHYID